MWKEDRGPRAPKGVVRRLGQGPARLFAREGLAEHGCDSEEGALLGDPPLVLPQQLRDAHGEPDLARDHLGHRDVLLRPAPRGSPMEREDADQVFVRPHRDGQHGARAEIEQRLTPAERCVVELRSGRDILDRHGGAAPRCEVRHGEMTAALDRRQAGPLPLRRRHAAHPPEPDEAPVDAECRPRFLHGDSKELVDVQL